MTYDDVKIFRMHKPSENIFLPKYLCKSYSSSLVSSVKNCDLRFKSFSPTNLQKYYFQYFLKKYDSVL